MTIHGNFIFYERILFMALSRLPGPGVSVASAAPLRAAFVLWLLRSSLDLCSKLCLSKSATTVPSALVKGTIHDALTWSVMTISTDTIMKRWLRVTKTALSSGLAVASGVNSDPGQLGCTVKVLEARRAWATASISGKVGARSIRLLPRGGCRYAVSDPRRSPGAPSRCCCGTSGCHSAGPQWGARPDPSKRLQPLPRPGIALPELSSNSRLTRYSKACTNRGAARAWKPRSREEAEGEE
jgi:hypothetical protein